MDADQELRLVADIRKYVTDNLPLTQLSDDELEEKIESITEQHLQDIYCPIEKRVSIVQQIYSSIRGLGLLDTIMTDDTITEVMINGPDNIFIEQNGRLQKLDKSFENQRKLEDVIQRIVGMAGREVNQANPIVDTTGAVDEYIENTTNGLVENIQGSIMTSIETFAVKIVGESNYNQTKLTKSDVQTKVDDLLNSMLSSATGDNTSDKAKRLAIEAIKTTQISDKKTGSTMTVRDYLVTKIYSAYCDAKEGILTSVSETVKTMLESVVDPIKKKITNAVASVGDELKSEVDQIISEGGDQVKEKVTSAIDKYMGNLSDTEGGKTAAATGFSLTYKEYIKAFMLLSITANKS